MKETIQNIKKAYHFAKRQKKQIILYACFSFLLCVIGILIPFLSAKLIVNFTNEMYIQLLLIAMAIFFTENVVNVIHYFNDKNAQIIYRETLIDLQSKLGEAMLEVETSCIDKHSNGVFIERLSNDAGRIADVFYTLNQNLNRIISGIGILIAIFVLNKIIFAFFLISLTIIFTVHRIRIKEETKKDKEYRKIAERTSGLAGELVRGVRDIKMLNAEKSFLENLKARVIKTNKSRYEVGEISRRYWFVSGVLYDSSDLILTILLIILLTKKAIDVPTAIVIYSYNNSIMPLIHYVSNIMDRLRDFNVSCGRVFELLESDEFKKETFGTKHLKKVEGNFEFKNVSFSYENNVVLKDLNFKVNANETVAFVGKSGAGKTTIFNLLCKMYDIENGEILIDGHNIKDLDKDSIRENITIINQNPYIFNMTIRENLQIVKKDVTEKEIKKACQMACLDEFINDLPDGYDTLIGEGGVNLSGGQRQRLAIARAFVQKTEIILFDEATSALDNETQSKIQQAIDNMKQDYTMLIIAHRLSTVVNANRILVIDNGKVIAEGTHQELLKKNKLYQELYEIELKK